MRFSFKKFLEKTFWTLINHIRGVRIYKRLIISFMIIILIPNLLISYYSFNISSRELENKFSSSSRQVLTGVEVILNEKLKLYDSLSYQVYNHSEIIEMLKRCDEYYLKKDADPEVQQKYEECKKKLGNILFQISPKTNISNLQIVFGDDQIIQIDNNGMTCGASIDDIASFIKSKNYQKALEADGLPVWFDTSKEIRAFKFEPYGASYIANYITLLRSIPDSVPNKSLGVIVINIPTNIFLEMVDFQSMYDSKEVVFLSGNKGIVSILNGRYNVEMPDRTILDEIADKKYSTIIRSISKKEYILTFRYQERLGVTIVYMAERSKILTGVFRVRNIIFEVTVICILCALILAYFVTASISLPMNRLKPLSGCNLNKQDNYCYQQRQWQFKLKLLPPRKVSCRIKI